MRPYLHRFDSYFIALIQSWPPMVRPLMKFISMTGFPFTTIGIGVVLLMYGIAVARPDLRYGGIIIFVTIAVSSLLKVFLRRPRPLTYTPKRWFIPTLSFPSGHSAGAAVTYGILGVLALQMFSFPVSLVLFVVAIVWTLLIGVSRIYLGAHYPTDVVAGWLLGALGVIVMIGISQ